MKKIVLFILIIFLIVPVFAQTTDEAKTREQKRKEKLEQKEDRKYQKQQEKKLKKEKPKELITLMGNVNSHGGYAGFGINYSEINKVPALSFEGHGSWVIGHSFAFGLGGTGFISDYSLNNELNEYTSFQGGYGGIYFEPIILPRFPVHISIPLFFGVGGIAEMYDYSSNYSNDYNYYDAASFIIFEPGAEVEINFFKHFRIALGGYYKMPRTISFGADNLVAEDVLEGLSLGVKFKLGKF